MELIGQFFRKKNVKLYMLISTLFFGFLAILLPPVIQWLKYGFVFYQNGMDEAIYLNYYFASQKASLIKVSLYCVVFLHKFGFSGGVINYILDSLSLLFISLFTYKILKQLFPKVNIEHIIFSLLVILFLPFVFTTQNPIISFVNHLIYDSTILSKYFVWNHSSSLTYLRTPESQISLTLFVATFWFSLRFNKPYIIVFALPFMYFFVSIYISIIFLVYFSSIYIEKIFGSKKLIKNVLFASFIAFFLTGIGLSLTYLFLKDEWKVPTHLPVFGISMLWLAVMLLLCKLVFNKTKISINSRRFILSVIYGTIIVYNTQIISGYFVQPQHFEHEIILLPGIFFTLYFLHSIKEKSRLKTLFNQLVYFVILIFICKVGVSSYQSNINGRNIVLFSQLLNRTNIKEELSSFPEKVAVNDAVLSNFISGFYLNKSKLLISSSANVFLKKDSVYVNFLSFKKYIDKQDTATIRSYKYLIDGLENGYHNSDLSFMPIFNFRRGPIIKKYSVPKEIPNIDYNLFILEEN